MNENYRYEIKFPVSRDGLFAVRRWHKMFGNNFRQTYPARIVNNIYFDSPAMQNYNDSVDGILNRIKCRLRWYGKTLTPAILQFEVKKRKNRVISKYHQKISGNILRPFPIKNLFSKLRLSLNNDLKLYLDHNYWPILFNEYHREYYENENNIRLTVDTNHQFSVLLNNPGSINKPIYDRVHAVIEIKLPADKFNNVRNLFNEFPVRKYRNSKYVNSIEILY